MQSLSPIPAAQKKSMGARFVLLVGPLGTCLACQGPARSLSELDGSPLPPSSQTRPAESSSPASSPVLPMFRRYPALQDKFFVLPIGSFPTPVEHAQQLGNHLGIHDLFLKRDDLSDSVCGGSKTRKLAFLLGEAVRTGAKKVVTFGGVGSNHALATAAFAKGAGLDVLLMLAPELPSEHVRESLLLERGLGAEMLMFPSVTDARMVADRLARSTAQGPRPYVIPPGGSSPLGNLGYVNAAFELKDQVERGLVPEPDVLYVAMGTMGTAVGLSIGLRAAGLKTRLVPVRASSRDAASESRMVEMLESTLALLQAADPSFPSLALDRSQTGIRHEYVGGGYAHPTDKGASAMRLFRKHTDASLEPTYTAKAFAAVVDDAPALRGKVVLFWNTQNSGSLALPKADAKDLPPAFLPYLRPAHSPL